MDERKEGQSAEQDPLQNPFSPERAYLTFQTNMEEAARLRDEVLRERETGEASDREMLLKAVDALGKATDNTILEKVIRRALEARDSA